MPSIMVFGSLEEVRGGVYTWSAYWRCLMLIYLMRILYKDVSFFLQSDKT